MTRYRTTPPRWLQSGMILDEPPPILGSIEFLTQTKNSSFQNIYRFFKTNEIILKYRSVNLDRFRRFVGKAFDMDYFLAFIFCIIPLMLIFKFLGFRIMRRQSLIVQDSGNGHCELCGHIDCNGNCFH